MHACHWLFCFGALACGINPTAAFASPAPALARPNIVIVMADDMGFSDLGCYGGEIDTPVLDALAAGGLRFTQFYNAGRCCPTRASLLTGLYPHQAGMGWMTSGSKDHPGYRGDLSRDTPTLAEVVRPAGYATYMAGKWHVSRQDLPTGERPNWPRQRGFDRFYGTNKGGAGYFDPLMLVRDDTPITMATDPEYRPGQSYYYTDAIADQAGRYIHEHPRGDGRRPFLLYVAFTAPHWPLHAPAAAVAKYRGRYDAGYEPIRRRRFQRQQELGIVSANARLSPLVGNWEAESDRAWEARCMEVYAAQVEQMDSGVGRIVAALRETGELERTLVLFLADNGGCAEKMGRQPVPKPARPLATRDGRPIRDGPGTMPGPDDTFIAYGRNWANVSNTPFRLYKHWVHEGGIASPLIAHWPDGIARRAALEHQPAHLIDIMATCLALSGATYPRVVNGRSTTPPEGVSLLPALRGEPLNRTAPIAWEHEGNRAIRVGDWKLVAKGEGGPWELYDLTSDRAESQDLAGVQPERVRDLAAQWQRWAERCHVLPLNPFKAPQQH